MFTFLTTNLAMETTIVQKEKNVDFLQKQYIYRNRGARNHIFVLLFIYIFTYTNYTRLMFIRIFNILENV